MSDSRDEKLEAMLRSRRIEPARPDLAERIILRSQSIAQNPTITFMQWLKQLFEEFRLPKPAYVLASTLLIGFVIGFSAPLDTNTASETDTVQVQGFLYADEGIL